MAGGAEGKRRLKKATSGKARPLNPSTAVKNNSQRVPPVGEVNWITAYRPPKPKTIRIMDAVKNDLTVGGDCESMLFCPYHPDDE